MGGATAKRKDNPISLLKINPEKPGKYGDPIKKENLRRANGFDSITDSIASMADSENHSRYRITPTASRNAHARERQRPSSRLGVLLITVRKAIDKIAYSISITLLQLN